MPERRYYPVPNGFAGDRVDAVLARLTGLSRHAAAKVIDESPPIRAVPMMCSAAIAQRPGA